MLQPPATVPFHTHKCRKYSPTKLFWAIAQKGCDKCPHRSCENNLMFLQKVSLQALWEYHSYKPCCGRFPTSLVGLAYNSKSCLREGPEGSWRVREGLGGSGRVLEGTRGSRRVWRSGRVLEGPKWSGRVQKGLEGSGRVHRSARVWKGPEHSGRVYKGPGGSPKVLEGLDPP